MLINIAAYHFVAVDDPERLAVDLRAAATALGLLGTMLVAGEGLNLFLVGEAGAIDTFVTALRRDPRFADIRIKRSESET